MKRSLFISMMLLICLTINAASGIQSQKGMAKTMPFDKSLLKKSAKVSNLRKAPMKSPLKADEAKTINLTITGSYTFFLDVDEDEGTSDWFFSATDETGMYNVCLDYPADEAGKYGTYTYDDIDHDYSYIKDMSTGDYEYRNFVEGTTFTVSEVNGKPHIEGTLVCDNGITYNIWFEHTPQTYNIEGNEITEMYYFDEDTDWYMRFNNDDYRITLDINTGSQSRFAGTYTEADGVEGYNLATDLNIGSYDPFTTFTVTLALPEGTSDPTSACEITGTALSEHGDTYNFHMLQGLPITPVKTVDLNVDLKKAEWPSKKDGCKSYFELTEKNADGSSTGNLWNIGLDALTGNLETTDIIETLTGRRNTVTGDSLAVDNGTVNLNFDVASSVLKVNAALVMKDSVEYRFSFDYPINIKGEVSYEFTNLSLNDSYYSDMGILWLNATNDDASMEVTLTNASVPGDYDDSNIAFTMAVRDADGEMSAVTSTVIMNASTALDEHNQPVLTARFLGSNKRIYNIDAHLDIPAVEDTLNLNIDGLKAIDLIDEIGVFQIYGYNNDSTVYVSIVPTATQFEGHYTTSDLTDYNSYCLFAVKKADGTYEQNDIYEADFDVTRADKEVTLTGKLRAGAHIINLTAKATIRPQGMTYDSEDEDLDVAFTGEDLTELEKGNGYAYVGLHNVKRGDIFAMFLYLSKYDDDIVIPEGTYEVNDTYSAPSVQPGQFTTSGLYPTFYATLGDDGYLYTPFWFLTSGTVTVKKTADNSLSLEVNGQNSWERTIHVTYDGTGTGIKDIAPVLSDDKGAKKHLENGRVVIDKNGKRYTLSGQILSQDCK